MTVRVGFVGAGAMGAVHLACLARETAGAQVVAVADPDSARTAELVRELGLRDTEITTDAERVVRSGEVDAVLVAAPDHTHEDLVLACIESGTPVLCEKPLATTAEGCRRVVDREVAHGRRLVQPGYMRRFDPGYVAMKNELDSGRLGAALMLHCQHRNATALPWFTHEMPLLNSAVHEIDIARWLLGEDVVRVEVRTPRRTRHAGHGLDDPRLVLLETSGGALVDVEVFVNARYGYDVRCELVAEDGTISLTPSAAIGLRSAGIDGSPVHDDFRAHFAVAYREQLQHWITAVASGLPVGASAWDGLATSRVAEACVRSARTDEPVHLDLPTTPPLYRVPPPAAPEDRREDDKS